MLLPAMAETDLASAIESKKPVLAVFTAHWCSNCRAFKPSIRKWLATRPEITALEVDVERYEKVADEHRIQSMPTIMAWKKGERVARHSGMMTEDGFSKWAERNLV